ncbi:uncharacterized protein B0H64DRAFT_454072 [Chaetomium fimeti]|uniref:Uncharacterized protein n=1 Tax=Chaetomium fimeti TaxID=1854472 RepID=A0AAE0HLA7_9PEZI|nr:hypothetical protein B0H64DRAFT_454072 [Chaetomium fimeti]
MPISKMNTITFVVPLTRNDFSHSIGSEDSMTPPRLPLTPMPPKLTAVYSAVFDSEDDIYSDYSDSFRSNSSNDLSFDKRSITPSPLSLKPPSSEGKKPSSLITIAVERSRAAASVTAAVTASSPTSSTTSSSSDWESYFTDDEADKTDSDGDYLPVAQKVAAAFIIDNRPMSRSAAESLTNLLADLKKSDDRCRRVRKQPPRLPATRIINAICKNIATNLEWYGNTAARLQVNHAQNQQEQQEQRHQTTTNAPPPIPPRPRPKLTPKTNTSPYPTSPSNPRPLPFRTTTHNNPPKSPIQTPSFSQHRRHNHHPTPPFPAPRGGGPATQTAPIPIPPNAAQRAAQRIDTEYYALPMDQSLVNERRQLAGAGPLGRGERARPGRGTYLCP